MERGQTPKILRLVRNSVFVPLPPPFYFKVISAFSFFLLFFLKAFKGQLVPRLHTIDTLGVLIIPGGFLYRSLI